MTRQLLLISFLSLILLESYSQKSMLTLSAGPSFPVGDFGYAGTYDSRSGFAGFGEQVNIGYDYKLGKYLSISVMVYGQRNSFARKAMQRKMWEPLYNPMALYASSSVYSGPSA